MFVNEVYCMYPVLREVCQECIWLIAWCINITQVPVNKGMNQKWKSERTIPFTRYWNLASRDTGAICIGRVKTNLKWAYNGSIIFFEVRNHWSRIRDTKDSSRLLLYYCIVFLYDCHAMSILINAIIQSACICRGRRPEKMSAIISDPTYGRRCT